VLQQRLLLAGQLEVRVDLGEVVVRPLDIGDDVPPRGLVAVVQRRRLQQGDPAAERQRPEPRERSG
jgi:hypothetical protein